MVSYLYVARVSDPIRPALLGRLRQMPVAEQHFQLLATSQPRELHLRSLTGINFPGRGKFIKQARSSQRVTRKVKIEPKINQHMPALDSREIILVFRLECYCWRQQSTWNSVLRNLDQVVSILRALSYSKKQIFFTCDLLILLIFKIYMATHFVLSSLQQSLLLKSTTNQLKHEGFLVLSELLLSCRASIAQTRQCHQHHWRKEDHCKTIPPTLNP